MAAPRPREPGHVAALRRAVSPAGGASLHRNGNLGGALNDYACGGGPATNVWVNQSAVKAALHVPADAVFFIGDDGEGMVYESTEKNVMPFYRELAASSDDVRVLVYNGDTDPGINSFVAQNWTAALGFEASEAWRPWTLDGCRRVGGYVTTYAREKFQFLTIRGAGHMVPEYKPAAALAFLRDWLRGDEFGRYDASCKSPPSR